MIRPIACYPVSFHLLASNGLYAAPQGLALNRFLLAITSHSFVGMSGPSSLTPVNSTPGEPGPSTSTLPAATKPKRTVRLFSQLPEESSSDEEGVIGVTETVDGDGKVSCGMNPGVQAKMTI